MLMPAQSSLGQSRLDTRKTKFQRREAVEWCDHLVLQVTSVSNAISRAIEFGVDSFLQGYMTEFAVDTITSYSEAIFCFQRP